MNTPNPSAQAAQATENNGMADVGKILSELGSSPQGLTSAEAATRLQKFGRNELVTKEKSNLEKFLAYFWNPIAWMIEAAAILAPDYPGSTIVTDSVTSDELTEFLTKELGLKHHRFKRGYKNVIDECIRLNEAGTVSPLAIETSGHGALSENYYLDDGAYLAVKLLIAAAKAKAQGRHLAGAEMIVALGSAQLIARDQIRVQTEHGEAIEIRAFAKHFACFGPGPIQHDK